MECSCIGICASCGTNEPNCRLCWATCSRCSLCSHCSHSSHASHCSHCSHCFTLLTLLSLLTWFTLLTLLHTAHTALTAHTAHTGSHTRLVYSQLTPSRFLTVLLTVIAADEALLRTSAWLLVFSHEVWCEHLL